MIYPTRGVAGERLISGFAHNPHTLISNCVLRACAACDVCVHIKDFKERDAETTALRRQFRGSALARGFGARNWHARGELD